jgi:hypothetical protein
MGVLLISEIKLKNFTNINKNVDMDVLKAEIQIAQDIDLQTIIGTLFYNHLLGCVSSTGNTFNPAETTLVNDYIQPYLIQQAYFQCIPQLMYRTMNRGIVEGTMENAASVDIDNPPPDYAVHGRDLMTGIPKEIHVSYVEIAHALDKSISKIEEAILSALEMTPPELSADIYRTGIYLAGGGSLLRGLDKRISIKTKLPVHIAEDPLRAVARGTGIALKNIGKFQFLIK